MHESVRILLIEDSRGDAAIVEQALEQNATPPFEVQTAGSLEQALEALAGGGFAAAVLDLELPDSRGLDTVQRVLDGAPKTPVVVVSGSVDHATARRCVHWGASAFLGKDLLRPEGLCAALRGAIERGRPKPEN